MKDQDEMFEAATETPAFLGCPSLGPKTLPSGFDGVESDRPQNANLRQSDESTRMPQEPIREDSPNSPDSRSEAKKLAELQKRGAKLFACNERSRARIVDIAHLANECLLNTNHPNGYEPGQYGSDYRTYGKTIGQIRKTCKESMVEECVPDYEWLAKIMTREGFEPECLEKAIEAEASQRPIDYPTFYTPGWLCELAKKLDPQNANLRQSDESTRMPQGQVREDSPNSPDSRSEAKLTPEEQSALQREEARQKRVIHWTCYPTKVDLCVMGKTEQNGKVYEVRIDKCGDSKVQDTYAQCKVNGKTVITCSFTGGAWMPKRILTAGMQALVNYKAKKARDRRRNYKKRDAAKRAAETAELIEKELA